MYASIAVTGRVFVRNQLKTLIPVAAVDYSNGVSVGNPVIAYLQRHGQVQGQTALFENSYSLTSALAPSTYIAPSTNEPYSKVSGESYPYQPLFLRLRIFTWNYHPRHVVIRRHTQVLGNYCHSREAKQSTLVSVSTFQSQFYFILMSWYRL